LLLLGVAVAPWAAASGEGSRIVRGAVLAALPYAIAVGLVQTFGAGSTVLFALGPFEATAEGLDGAAQATLRILIIAAALTLFGVTTRAAALVADLESRGASPRIAFAGAATLTAVPMLVEQARVVRDAQRARGLDIDAGVVGRLRGILPLAGPVMLGTLHGVEQRALALEARAFGRPGHRDVSGLDPEAPWERPLRWALAAAMVVLVVAAVSGLLPRLP
jgi:energy-coupling factor transport system permease protein